MENSSQISSKGCFFDCGTIYSPWQGFKAFRAQLLKLYELIAHPAHQHLGDSECKLGFVYIRNVSASECSGAHLSSQHSGV